VTEKSANRLIAVELDESLGRGPSPDAEHERSVAIYDLVEDNRFALSNGTVGPYRLKLLTQDNRLLFDVQTETRTPLLLIGLSLSPFRRVVTDYFQICDSYYDAIRAGTVAQIETIDMARRAIHNEGAEILMQRMQGKVETDHETARRLFTLISALIWKN
jgi:uncharacterized protein (UPF0262 family)